MNERKNRFTASEISFIHRQRVARLATSDADGHPTLVPVCYAFDGERFYSPLDEKPKSIDARKLKRVRYIQYQTMALEKLPVIVITPESVSKWGPAVVLE